MDADTIAHVLTEKKQVEGVHTEEDEAEGQRWEPCDHELKMLATTWHWQKFRVGPPQVPLDRE